MNSKFLFLTLAGLTGLGACGSSDSSSGNALGVSGTITTVRSAVAKADIASYTASPSFVTSKASLPRKLNPFTATVMDESDWSTASNSDGVYNLYCGTGNTCSPGGSAPNNSVASPQKWVHDMLDPSFVNNTGTGTGLMGRFYSAVGQACTLSAVMGGTGLPAAGTSTLSVTPAAFAAANTACGTNQTGPDSTIQISLTVTDVSSSGVGAFDRKIEMVNTDLGLDQVLFIKNDGTNLRIMVSGTSNGGEHMSRYYADFNSSTQVAHFEGLERGYPTSGSDGFYFYRIYTNASSGAISILGQNGGVSYGASGLYTQASTAMGGIGSLNSSDATIEILTHNAGSTGSTPGAVNFDEIACVNTSTGVVDTAYTGACTAYPLDLTAAADALVNGAVGGPGTAGVFGIAQGDWKMDETVSVINFDGSTIFSAAATN